MTSTRYLFFLLLFCLAPNSVNASAVESIKSFILEAKTVSATFSQTLLDKNAQAIQESSGTMMFERPDKFRWTYEKPYQQLIVGDGNQVWFYDQDLEQVTVRQLDLAIGNSPAALLTGNISIENNFELVEIGFNDHIEWLKAVPKENDSTFEVIQIGFSPDGVLKMMVLQDNFGQTTLLTFSNLIKNPKLSADLFIFTPPDGTDIISD